MEETLYESVIRQSSFGFAYHEIILDAGGNPFDYLFLDVNSVFEELSGVKSSELLNRRASEVFPNDIKSVERITLYGRVAKNCSSETFEYYSVALRRWYNVMVLSLKKGFFITLFEDITDRFMVIETLKESEDKYRSLTDQLPVGVYRTSVDGRLVYSNPALVNMLNYDSAEELLQLVNASQLYANPSDRGAQLEGSRNPSGVIQSEFQLKKKSGDLIWVKDNSRLVFDRYGNPAYFDGILEDTPDCSSLRIR